MKTNGPMPLVGGARLPLAFIACGLGALLGATAWLAVAPALALQPPLYPHVVALAHLWLPGFLLSVCFGATYQLAPVVLGAPLAWERVTWLHLALHAVGLPVFVVGFATSRYALVASGGSAVAVGVGLFAANVWVTFARAERRDAIGWSLPLAAGWLGLTVVAGLVLAASRLGWSLAVSPLALLRAHAHAGLVGFFVTLVQGVAFQLVPMFTLGAVKNPRRVALGLGMAQAGLVLLTTGLGFSRAAVTWTGAGLLAGGIFCSGIELAATLRSRRKRALEPGLRAFVAGAALVGAGVAGGVGLLLVEPGVGALRGTMAYGIVVIAGALALMVMGMLCKIIPFLVWMRAYGPRVGRQPVPPAHTLGHPVWERVWLGLHPGGVAVLAAGAGSGSEAAVRAGAWLLAGGVILFLCSALRIVAHLRVKNHGAAVVRKADGEAVGVRTGERASAVGRSVEGDSVSNAAG